MIELEALSHTDPLAVEALLDHAFGLDRHTRTAYRVRGAANAVDTLGFAARADGALVGTIQCWPVALSTDAGVVVPLVMVGPVAVEPTHQLGGIGRMLMTHMLEAARVAGMDDALMLIGDPEYYGRFFGFTAARTGRWRLPGPVEGHRLLARGDAVPDAPGMLGPMVAA